MRAHAAAAALLWAALPAAAGSFGSSARGTATAPFLSLGAGARAAALGEAYAAVAGDASALAWNPAGLTLIEKRSATLMHAVYLDSSFLDDAAFGQKAGDAGAWGAGVRYFNAGSIEQTDATGTGIGEATPHDLAVSLGYAFTLEGGRLDGVSIGLAAKFVRSELATTAQTVALDAGLLSPALLDGKLRLALTAQNIGGQMKFERVSEDLPLALRLGGAVKLTERWLASADAGLPKHDSPYLAVGTEYVLPIRDAWSLAVRGGINTSTLDGIDGFSGVSFGLGADLGGYGVDYAFLPLGGLGQAHRLSLSFEF